MAKNQFWADFKAFAVKGNIIDLAVGVVVGGAFGKIVSSLVNDIIMPAVGWLAGGVNLSDMKVALHGTLASNVADKVDDIAGNTKIAQSIDSLAAPITDHIESSAENVVYLNYGNFIQQFIDFFIISFCIFLVIRALTIRDRKKKEREAAEAAAKAAEPQPKPEDIALLEEIRDLLKKDRK